MKPRDVKMQYSKMRVGKKAISVVFSFCNARNTESQSGVSTDPILVRFDGDSPEADSLVPALSLQKHVKSTLGIRENICAYIYAYVCIRMQVQAQTGFCSETINPT